MHKGWGCQLSSLRLDTNGGFCMVLHYLGEGNICVVCMLITGIWHVSCVMKKSQTAKAWTLNAFEGMCGRCWQERQSMRIPCLQSILRYRYTFLQTSLDVCHFRYVMICHLCAAHMLFHSAGPCNIHIYDHPRFELIQHQHVYHHVTYSRLRMWHEGSKTREWC